MKTCRTRPALSKMGHAVSVRLKMLKRGTKTITLVPVDVQKRRAPFWLSTLNFQLIGAIKKDLGSLSMYRNGKPQSGLRKNQLIFLQKWVLGAGAVG